MKKYFLALALAALAFSPRSLWAQDQQPATLSTAEALEKADTAQKTAEAYTAKAAQDDTNSFASDITADGFYLEAIQFYRIAAERHDARAEYYLGWDLWNQGMEDRLQREANTGVLVEFKDIPDLEEAVDWIQKSVKQGYAPAQYRMGWFYETGNFFKKDLGQAKSWYGKAAGQGDEDAKEALKRLE